jgi:hypothetical protein
MVHGSYHESTRAALPRLTIPSTRPRDMRDGYSVPLLGMTTPQSSESGLCIRRWHTIIQLRQRCATPPVTLPVSRDPVSNPSLTEIWLSILPATSHRSSLPWEAVTNKHVANAMFDSSAYSLDAIPVAMTVEAKVIALSTNGAIRLQAMYCSCMWRAPKQSVYGGSRAFAVSSANRLGAPRVSMQVR